MSNIRPLCVEGINYLIDIKKQCGQTAINLTDLKSIWHTHFSESEAVKKFKDENSLIRSSDKWIAEYIVNILNNLNTKIEMNFVESNIKICFLSDISGLETKMRFTLNLQPPDMIYKEITLPLLMIINELKYRQEKLLNVLNAKDVEIKEFKFEGASITRKNAITQPFSAESFDLECTSTLSDRAEEILKNPTSVIYPISDLYTKISNTAATTDIKKEMAEETNRNNEVSADNESKNDEITKIDIAIKKESELEMKRKITEALSRSKRPKKLYKI